MLCSNLANTPTVQLLDPSKPYLLFMNVSTYCNSGVLTETSTEESNEALVHLLTGNDPLTSVDSQTQDLKLNANLIHPIVYISGSFTKSQCRWPAINIEFFLYFYVYHKMLILSTLF